MPIYFLPIYHYGAGPMMVVQIEKPANMKLAVWFTELRSWFDTNNCQPAAFTSVRKPGHKLIFQVTFSDNSQAHLFATTFSMYIPDPGEHKQVTDAGLTDRELGGSRTLEQANVSWAAGRQS
jgi:hypothetical protein